MINIIYSYITYCITVLLITIFIILLFYYIFYHKGLHYDYIKLHFVF